MPGRMHQRQIEIEHAASETLRTATLEPESDHHLQCRGKIEGLADRAPAYVRASAMSAGRPLPAAVLILLSTALLTSGCDRRLQEESGAGGTGDPRLVVDRGVIDLGDVPVGKWATATFTLRNAGSAPLRFIDAPWVKAVAGC